MTITTSSNDTAAILLIAKVRMKVTDLTRDTQDGDEDGYTSEYTSMTSKLTFTYGAYCRFIANGKEYISETPVVGSDGTAIADLPLNLAGTPIKLTLPTLVGIDSRPSMYVQHTTDGGENYSTIIGDFIIEDGLTSVTFTTSEGFDGEYRFLPCVKHWVEECPAIEPTFWSEGREQYWYSKNYDEYYEDIFCTTKLEDPSTKIIPKLSVGVSFDKNADDATGTMNSVSVTYGDNYVLPECAFTRNGYEFIGWFDGYCVYQPGDKYKFLGNTTFYARWKNNSDNIITVNFVAGDGSGEPMKSVQVVSGDSIELPECTYTHDTLGFRCWSQNEGGTVRYYDVGQKISNLWATNHTATFTAEWCPLYTVSFDANGGEGTMEPQAYVTAPYAGDSGWAIISGNVPKNTFTREKYEFLGWNKNPGSSNALIKDGGAIYGAGFITGDTTLYAVWKQLEFHATYDKNAEDAVGTMPTQHFDTGIEDYILPCEYTREGYEFVKWNTEPDGSGNNYYKGNKVSLLRDMTFYAQWQKTRKITYHANGAEGEMEPKIVKDQTYDYLDYNSFTRSGYEFNGWNTMADGTGTSYSDHRFMQFTSDMELYAQWKKTRFDITYDANGGEGETGPQLVDFGAEGMSTVCPRCSSAYTKDLTNPDMAVHFCNCCGFGVVNKDEGSTANLAVRSSASFSNYTLGTKFDELSSQYASLIGCYPDKDFTQVSSDHTEEYAAYSALYAKASELMDKSLSEATKNIDYSMNTCAIVGITDDFVLTAAENEHSVEDTIGAAARLFGFNSANTFRLYAQSAAAAYIGNEAGAATNSASARLKYEGAVFTTNGSFVLPYAFRCDASDSSLLAFVIIDADQNVAVWISDLSALYYTTLYGLELPENVDPELEVYGRCTLYENPKPLENKFTRDRYSFNRWNTSPDGTGTTYYATSTFYSTMKEDLTLYAQWTPDFCTITFDPNGGEGTMEPQIVDKGVETPLNANTFTRDGYVFAGWNTYASSYASIADGGNIQKSSDTTLYAVWKRNVTITFDPNGGTGTMEPQVVPEATSIRINKNTFKNDNLVFAGWATAPDGACDYSDGGLKYISKGTEDFTLYALWKEKTNASSIASLDNMELTYDGEPHQIGEIQLAFEGQTLFTKKGSAKYSYEYYRGSTVEPENRMPNGEYPTNAGRYTVLATYEDDVNVARRTATMTINKAERTLVADSVLLLFGKSKTASILVDGDADGSANASDVIMTSGNTDIVKSSEAVSYKSGSYLMVAVDYVGEGYTYVNFRLSATANYEAACTNMMVISKDGYNVNAEATEGGTVKVDKPKASEGTTVNVAAEPKLGWTLEKTTVTHENTYITYDLSENSFTMPECNVTVGAVFTQNEYNISYVEVPGLTYGQSVPASAHCGDIVTLTANADGANAVKGFRYTLEDNTAVNITPDKNGEFTFDMPAGNITVEAILGDLHTVMAESNLTGGTITVSDSSAAQGATITVTPIPAEGYKTGNVTYTAGTQKYPVTVGVGENDEQTYSLVMPDESITVSAEFIQENTLDETLSSVNDTANEEKGKTETQLDITVDDSTARALLDAVSCVNVDMTVSGSREVNNAEKASAVEALAQAGMITVEGEGDSVTLKDSSNNDAQVRVVEKTYLDVQVKGFEQTDAGTVMTIDITPMKQTVATIQDPSTQIGSDNSVPLTTPQRVDLTGTTNVTVGITNEMAIAAGGAGKTIYVRHTHDGKTYEYPAVISGNDQNGYTAEFSNPNGYSEFTLSVESSTVAAYDYNGVSYFYTSFAEAIEGALDRDVALITMYRMPTGEDAALVTKAATLTFAVAPGCEEAVDLDALYVDWLEPDLNVRKASTAAQLAEHRMCFIPQDSFENPFCGFSLTLSGQIGVNFYLDPQFGVDAGDVVTFTFTVNRNGVPEDISRDYIIRPEDLMIMSADGVQYSCYEAACFVSAAEMTSVVTASITKNETTYTNQMSVIGYGQLILDDTSGKYDEETKALVKAMLYYGSTAQTLFNCNTDAPASAAIGEYAAPAEPGELTNCDITKMSAPEGTAINNLSLLLETETTLRLYFNKVDDLIYPDLIWEYEDENGTVQRKTYAAKEKNGEVC